MRLIAFVLLLLVGCNTTNVTPMTGRSDMRPDELRGTWNVAAVGTDCGHLTYEDVSRDHTYVLGIECEREAESILLFYYDRLPGDLVLTVGDRLSVDATDEAEFEPAFGGGFWIRDLRLTVL